MPRHALIIAIAALAGLAGGTAWAEGVASDFETGVGPVLLDRCLYCHSEDYAEAGLKLDAIDADAPEGRVWDRVRDRVAAGEMPPEDEGPLTEDEREALLAWSDHAVGVARERALGEGPERLRRLSKPQYAAALHELLDTPLSFADALPDDPKSRHGFSNSVVAQETSSLQLEYYRQIAERALRRTIVEGARPEPVRIRATLGEGVGLGRDYFAVKGYQVVPISGEDALIDVLDPGGTPYRELAGDHSERLARFEKNLGVDMRGSHKDRFRLTPEGMVLMGGLPHREVSPHTWRGPSPHMKILARRCAPQEGPFTIRLRCRPLDSDESRLPAVRAFLGARTDDGMEYKTIGPAIEVRPSDDLQEIVFRGDLEDFPLPVIDPNDTDPLSGIFIFGVWNDHLVKDSKDSGPELLVRSIEFEAPAYEQWPPASHERVLLDSPQREADRASYTREVIGRFAERAFRRPVSDNEVERYHAFWREVAPHAESYEEGVRQTLTAVLCSPSFLYTGRPPAGAEPHDLASRLAFFLWNAPPDKELLQLAAAGNLREELPKQVERMVRDPRAWDFVRNFTHEWLRLDRHETMSTSVRKHPDYTRYVKQDMTEETGRFVLEMLRSDRPITQLIDADFTVLNQNLAEFYGVEGVMGNAFRHVSLAGTQRLGGLLLHGAFLNGHSDGIEPHPIKRAIWLRERLLGDSPPPPPPNVPELEEPGKGAEKLTLKQRLEEHRNKPSCLACHEGIDPYGVVFEGFDAVGRPRKERKHSPIDARSVMPDGTELNGVEETRSYLVQQRADELVRSLATYLYAYAVGVEVDYVHRPEVDRLANEVGPEGRMIDLIQALVASDAFSGAPTEGDSR